jgi:hypothetical protein
MTGYADAVTAGEVRDPDLPRFLARLLRLDPGALVRLRPEEDGTRAWAMLPFRVLVSRPVAAAPPADVTLGAADLLATLGDGDQAPARRRDGEWRWPLPSARGKAVETVPVSEVVRLAEAAARTVRTASTEGVGGRAVGERALRDALLDHIAIVVVTDEGERLELPQRLIQALVRMGLHAVTGDTNGDGQVTVRLIMGWIGLETRHGSAWYRPISPLRLG